jgi:hypothetical protein
MTTHHLDLLLDALLYGCAFSGELLAAASLALPAVHVAGAAAADLSLARAVAANAVVKATVRLVLVARPNALASLVSRGSGSRVDDRAALRRGFGFVLCGAERSTAV